MSLLLRDVRFSMRALSTLSAAFLLTVLAVPCRSYAGQESEVEFRLPLTDRGYALLREGIDFEESKPRADLYLDIFDVTSGELFLRRWKAGGKLRIMSRPDKSKWQVSYKSAQQFLDISGFKVRVSERVKDEVSSKKEPDLFELNLQGVDILALLGRDAAIEGNDLGRALAEFTASVTSRSRLTKVLPVSLEDLPGCVLPLAHVSKDRFSKTVLIEDAQLKLQLGRSTYLDENGDWVNTWEIEAERSGPLVGDEGAIARGLVSYLEERGLSVEDTIEQEEQSDLSAWALRRYEAMDPDTFACSASPGTEAEGTKKG